MIWNIDALVYILRSNDKYKIEIIIFIPYDTLPPIKKQTSSSWQPATYLFMLMPSKHMLCRQHVYIGKAGADAVALSALYKGRVAILNQYVSDSFGKLADRPSMMPVILNATFEPVESTQYTAPRPLPSTPSSEVQPAPELEPESKAVQVLRLEFSDHLAFMLVVRM